LVIACPQAEDDVAQRLRRDHPLRNVLSIFAINVDAANREIHRGSVSEAKLSLQVDLYERTEVCLLGLIELIPPVSARVLPIEQHVVRAP
jgi:hypothetical protein